MGCRFTRGKFEVGENEEETSINLIPVSAFQLLEPLLPFFLPERTPFEQVDDRSAALPGDVGRSGGGDIDSHDGDNPAT